MFLFYADIFQFQFLYPFILDPMWIEASVEKQDVRALSNNPRIFNSVTAVHENKVKSEKSQNAELESSPTVSSLQAKEVQPNSVDVSSKVSSK